MSLSEDEDTAPRRAWLVFVPLALFAIVAVLFVLRLGAGDASRLPSALIGKPVPAFALAPVPGLGKPGLDTAALANGKITVLNVFASWCGPCREEQPALLDLAKSGQPILGMAYKDKPEDTRRFLADEGDPYAAVGADATGRTGIDFGVYGVPETYVIDGKGTIKAKIVGPLTEATIRDQLMPAIAKASAP